VEMSISACVRPIIANWVFKHALVGRGVVGRSSILAKGTGFEGFNLRLRKDIGPKYLLGVRRVNLGSSTLTGAQHLLAFIKSLSHH
jgi:hypothetical protein